MSEVTTIRSAATVAFELIEERLRQVNDHGYDVEHDDRHTPAEWGWLLGRRASDLACPWPSAQIDVRRQLVEIAAISIAAIESWDRTH